MTSTDRLNGLTAAVAIKAPVKAATTANITLSGLQTIDGVSCAAGDRVLVKNQATPSENGIYVVSSTAWTRAKDFDGNRDVVTGTQIYVTSGTQAGIWRITTSGTITIGATSLAFTQDTGGGGGGGAVTSVAGRTGAVTLAVADISGQWPYASISGTPAIPTKLNDLSTATGNYDMGAYLISSSGTPTTGNHLVNKTYADALSAGFLTKTPVRVATTTTLPANTYANGSSGVGATLTANSNGAFASVDGVTLAVNDRILVKNESSQTKNGIYYLSTLGDGSNPWVLTRATDSDTAAEILKAYCLVTAGATNRGSAWLQTSPTSGITMGSSSLVFTQYTAAQVAPIYFNVKDYGALGDGSTDDATAIQAAIDAAKLTGGVVFFPRGKYYITAGLVCNLSSIGINSSLRVSFMGESASSTWIVWNGSNSSSNYILDYGTTDTTSAYAGDYGFIKGLTFRCASGKSKYANGLRIVRRAFFEAENLWFYDCDYGLEINSTIISTFRNIIANGNNYGVVAKNGTSAFSSCNENHFENLRLGDNLYGGVDYQNGSFTVDSGSIEGNGASNTSSAFGIKLTRNSDQIGNEGIGLVIQGHVYFEGNGSTTPGKADIWIEHTETQNLIVDISGATFNRTTSVYCTNNIFWNHSSTGSIKLITVGNTFRGLAGYTEDAARRYIEVSGTGTYRDFHLDNYYNDTTAMPNLGQNGTRLLNNSAMITGLNKIAVGINTSTSAMAGTHTDISWTDSSDPYSMISGANFTVPAGVEYGEFSIILPVLMDAATFVDLSVYYDGTVIDKAVCDTLSGYSAMGNLCLHINIGPIPVVAGKIFKAQAKYGASGGGAVSFGNNSGFGALIVDQARAILKCY